MGSSNRLLSSLPEDIFAALRPLLKQTKMVFGAVVAIAQSDVDRVYFPHSGVVSLVVQLKSGDTIETAMIGRDGVVNASAALDGKLSFNKAVVQLEGEASMIDIEPLRELADQFKPLRALLTRHEQVLFAQAQQSAACNASHSVESRMCRWLLRMRDLADDDLQLTQEFLGQMLGVRRTSVSLVASELQKEGLIKYRRGRIQIIDVAGLQKATCECYETVKSHYNRIPDDEPRQKAGLSI